MESIGTPLLWSAFAVFVLLALCVDLVLMRSKGAHRVGTREAMLWSAFWIFLALVFNAWLWWYLDRRLPAEEASELATQFFTGYLLEKALAVDNMFVFLMLFNYFAVPQERQQRVLIYGVVGAILLRAVMIFIGAALIAQFHWILYLFGLFLLITGAQMIWRADDPPNLDGNPILRWMSGHLRLTRNFHDDKFRVNIDGVWHFTPLFLVMVMIAFTDVIFAVDSIPAIFAITTDPFIVLTSNVFAVLGLRALYFLLAAMADRFHLLKYGLAFVLMFIGMKMLIVDFWKVPVGWALLVVVLAIAVSMVVSLMVPPRKQVD
ncbi:MAG: TerC family protein [Pseudomarimonas sp.]